MIFFHTFSFVITSLGCFLLCALFCLFLCYFILFELILHSIVYIYLLCVNCFICWALLFRISRVLKIKRALNSFSLSGPQYWRCPKMLPKINWQIRWTHRRHFIREKRENVPAKRHCHKRPIHHVRVCKCSRSYRDLSISKILRSVSFTRRNGELKLKYWWFVFNFFRFQNMAPYVTVHCHRVAVRIIRWTKHGRRHQIRRKICTRGWRNSIRKNRFRRKANRCPITSGQWHRVDHHSVHRWCKTLQSVCSMRI